MERCLFVISCFIYFSNIFFILCFSIYNLMFKQKSIHAWIRKIGFHILFTKHTIIAGLGERSPDSEEKRIYKGRAKSLYETNYLPFVFNTKLKDKSFFRLFYNLSSLKSLVISCFIYSSNIFFILCKPARKEETKKTNEKNSWTKVYDMDGCFCLIIAILNGVGASTARRLYDKGPVQQSRGRVSLAEMWYPGLRKPPCPALLAFRPEQKSVCGLWTA